MKSVFLGGGWGGGGGVGGVNLLVNDKPEAHNSLSTSSYPVNIR